MPHVDLSIERLRFADVDDRHRWSLLFADFHALCFEHAWSSESFRELVNLETTAFYGAFYQQQLWGLLVIQNVLGEAEVLTLGVDPGHRRAGIATKLLHCSMQLSEVSTMFLDVAETNCAARGLYESLGFLPVGRRSGYYHQSEFEVDAILYKWDERTI